MLFRDCEMNLMKNGFILDVEGNITQNKHKCCFILPKFPNCFSAITNNNSKYTSRMMNEINSILFLGNLCRCCCLWFFVYVCIVYVHAVLQWLDISNTIAHCLFYQLNIRKCYYSNSMSSMFDISCVHNFPGCVSRFEHNTLLMTTKIILITLWIRSLERERETRLRFITLDN